MPDNTALFGTDLSCVPDLDPFSRTIAGPAVLVQDLVKRFSTTTLFYASGYGLDLRSFLSSAITDQTLFTLKQSIENQCLLDERVQSARASVVFNGAARTLTIMIGLVTAAGPFTMIVGVDKLNVSLIGMN